MGDGPNPYVTISEATARTALEALKPHAYPGREENLAAVADLEQALGAGVVVLEVPLDRESFDWLCDHAGGALDEFINRLVHEARGRLVQG